MAFGVKSLSVVEATLACAATATLMYFGNGLNPVWPLMWVAPLPVLWFATRRFCCGTVWRAQWLRSRQHGSPSNMSGTYFGRMDRQVR
jgi:hypothetical protein